MAADLKDLMDKAVAGLSLPPQFAASVAEATRRRHRRHRMAAVTFAIVAAVLGGLVAWSAVGTRSRSSVSTLTPAGPPSLPTGVVIAPDARQAAPSLLGSTVAGGEFNLLQWRGNVVAVNFWGSWLAPSRAQVPALQRLSDGLTAQGVTFVGVDERDTRANAQAFLKSKGITYQSVFDANGQLTAQWPESLAGPPYTYVVDRRGRIAALFVDGGSTAKLEDAIKQVAAERPPLTVEVTNRHVWFPYGQASLDPPSRAQAPADPGAAWKRIAATLPDTICEGARTMVVQFGLFTNYLVASTSPLRYEPYDYRKVPEWVVRCTDVPQPPSSAPALAGQPTNKAQGSPYTLQLIDSISVFDGRTGKLLNGFDDAAS